MSYEDDSAYLVYGDFGLFLKELIKSLPGATRTNEVLTDSLKLLSEMLSSSNEELANLIVVNVFESLAGSVEREVARKYLSGKALDIFERVLKGWAHA